MSARILQGPPNRYPSTHPSLCHLFSILNLGDLPPIPMWLCYPSGVPRWPTGCGTQVSACPEPHPLPPVLPTLASATWEAPLHTSAITHLTLLMVFLPPGTQLPCFFVGLILLPHSGITSHLCVVQSPGSFILCILPSTGAPVSHSSFSFFFEGIISFSKFPQYILGSLNMFSGHKVTVFISSLPSFPC